MGVFLLKKVNSSTLCVVFCLFLISLTIFSIISLSHPIASAAEISASTSVNATVSVLEACTMYEDYNTYVPHTASIPAGTNKSDIGLSTFRVICNDAEGFSVYAVGFANYELGNTKLLATINGTLNPTYDIETGLNMTNTTSSWAMKLTAVSGTYAPTIQSDTNGSFASYHVVPATNTKVATFAGVTDGGNNANGSAFTATYRANISGTQPAGNYNGKVKYTMVHPANATPNEPKNCGTANRICYWPNAEGTYEGTMGKQTANANTSVTLIASNFSRNGYGFAGWSDAYDYIPNEGSPSNPDAHIYGPNEDITTPSSMTNGLSLYAVWVKSEGTLQGWTGCNSLWQGNVTALTDQRDGQTYAVAKLADGNCWMIENLRLESTNLDNSTGSLAQGYGTSATYGNFSGLANAESSNFSDAITANSLYYSGEGNQGSLGATIDIGTTDLPGYRMPRYNNTNTSARANSPTTGTNVYIYSYGNYYTWHAAIADTTAYTSNDTSVTNTSLCPFGWRLPKGGDKSNEANNEFWSLIVTDLNNGTLPANYESSARPNYMDPSEYAPIRLVRDYPNNFIYSGHFWAGANNRGSEGLYWSSTTYNGYNSYDFSLYSSPNLYPGTSLYGKHYGGSVRCITGP